MHLLGRVILVTAVATAWFAGAHASMRMATGSYTGDGNDNRAITAVGFQPDVVIVKLDGSEPTFIRTSTMTGDASKSLVDAFAVQPNMIQSFTANGYIVGNDKAVNGNAEVYYWIAFKSDPTEMVVGKYDGDGTDDRSITTVGFQPDYMIVFSEDLQVAMQRFSASPADKSVSFEGSGDKPDRIQAFEPTGFQVGKHGTVNENNKTFHYIAWKSVAGRISTDTYTGDGVDGRTIPGVGFPPKLLTVVEGNSKLAVFRTDSMGGDNSFQYRSSNLINNRIQNLSADGFEVGDDAEVNTQNGTYYWAAFGGVDVDLSVTVGVDQTSPGEGDTIAYAVVLANTGPDPATGVVVTDSLPAGLNHVSIGVSHGTYTSSTGIWSIGDLAAGDSALLLLTATVDPGTGGTTITNVAEITAVNQSDPDPSNDVDSVSVTVLRDGRVYYVSPTGDDNDDGLSIGSAWATIDNGDVKGLLVPGDSVLILPGTYDPTLSVILATSGAALSPIVYRGVGNPRPSVRGIAEFDIQGSHVVLDSLRITSATGDGLKVSGDSCYISHCIIEETGKKGIKLAGHANIVFRTVIRRCPDSGIKIDKTTDNNHVIGSTIYGCAAEGIRAAGASTARVINNIVVMNGVGIDGDAATVSAFNDVWNNPGGDYMWGALDSAGGISVDPMFADSAGGDFRLLLGSPAIDAGLDLGYPFLGGAPDMGAEESDLGGSPPEIAPIAPQGVVEGQKLAFAVTATDADSTIPLLTAENLPANAVFVNNGNGTGDFDFTPDFSQSGAYAVSFIASDGKLADTEVVLVSVIDVNQAPVLDPIGPQSVDEGQSLALGVSASDPDATVPTLTAENVPTNATFVDNLDGTGLLSFDPDFTQAGLYNVRVIASDGALADTELVAIAVNNVNRAPVLVVPGPQTVDEGQRLDFTVKAADPDAENLLLSAENRPLNATFTDSGNGVGLLTFDPDFTQAGVYTVRFIASDGALADTGSVTVTVTNVNRSPVLTPISDRIVAEGQRLTIPVVATDPDSTPLTLSAENLPLNAIFVDSGNGTGAFTFDPQQGQVGVYHVTFICTDGVLADSEFVTITVTQTNFPPVLTAIGPQSLTEGDTLILPVSATDPEGSTPTLVAENVPLNGTFTDSGNGTGMFTFTPNYVQAGSYEVRFIASDGSLADSETVTITVNEAGNQPPQLAPINDTTVQGGMVLTITVIATDPDSTKPILLAELLPANSTFTDSGGGGGGFTFAPDLSQLGDHGIRFIATDGPLEDTAMVIVTVVAGLPVGMTVSPDSVSVSADSSVQFVATCFDSLGNPTDCGGLTWGLTASVGTIDAAGLFDATTVGSARVYATSSFGLADTTTFVGVTAGRLAQLVVSPDSATLLPLETQLFTVNGTDGDGNAAAIGNIAWSFVGDAGTIDGGGLFSAGMGGTGQVVATSDIDGITDTTGTVRVVSSDLNSMVVSPDTASLLINSTASFTALGLTQDFLPADVGDLTWEVVGGIGTIDQFGNFIATQRGVGRVAATSNLDGVADTSNAIVVDVLMSEEIPLGNRFIHAGDSLVPLLGFTIDNRFPAPRGITNVTVHNDHRGAGNDVQLRSNTDTYTLYHDINANRALDVGDTALGSVSSLTAAVDFVMSPVTIGPGEVHAFFIAGSVGTQPRDGDSLDVYLVPTTDIMTTDASVVGGDTLNSLGYAIVDGMIADQLQIATLNIAEISPADGLVGIFAIDIPRNGYSADALEILSLSNTGTAAVTGFDSLVLFADDGNGQWDGVAIDIPVGNLEHTGGLWSISGLAVPVDSPVRRFYIAAAVSVYAENAATIALGIPEHGVEMTSGNDGPIDRDTPATGAVLLKTTQTVTVAAVDVSASTLIPGRDSGPLLGLRILNGKASAIALSKLDCTLLASDPDGAGQLQLDSQIDSVMLWLDRDGNPGTIGADDNLLTAAPFVNGAAVLRPAALPIAGAGGEVVLLLSVAMDLHNAKNGNAIRLEVATPQALEFTSAVTVAGGFPVASAVGSIVDAFPAASAGVNGPPAMTLLGGDEGRVVLDFTLPRNGYSNDGLSSIGMINTGTVREGEALLNVALWADATGDGFGAGDVFLGYFVPQTSSWMLDQLQRPLTGTANRFFIVVDLARGNFEGGTLRFEVPVDGAVYASGTDGPDDEPIADSVSHLVLPSDRITVISIPSADRPVAPGSADNVVLTFALYNGYTDASKHLRAVRFANATRSRSDAAFADQELGQVSFYVDRDGNRLFSDDSLLAVGYLSDGNLRVSGFDLALPPEDLAYFFAVVDIPTNVVDNDSLALEVTAFGDFEFAEVVNVNGDVPLSGGGSLIIDGSVASQYTVVPISIPALQPGDTEAPLFAFRPASNGNLGDDLEIVRVVNLGSADGGDLVNVRLWVDVDEDLARSAADQFLGTAAYAAGEWTIPPVGLTITADPPVLLLTTDIDSAATPDATVQLAIPIDGCEYASTNDGPIDTALVSADRVTISNSILQIAKLAHGSTYSVGQEFDIGVAITNTLTDSLPSVLAEIVSLSNPGAVRLDSVLQQNPDYAPGESKDHRFYYTAATSGSVSWDVRATATQSGDSSATVALGPILIQQPPTNIGATFLNSMPPAATRGQPNIVPFSLRLDHPESAPTFASVSFQGLVLNMTDGAGSPVMVADVTDRIVATTGQSVVTVLENPPNASSVLLSFQEPVILGPGEHEQLTVLLDIKADAAANAFAVSLDEASSIAPLDANTLAPVALDPGVVFPLITETCAILNPADNLAVGASSLLGTTANRGQQHVDLIELRLRHSGAPGSSQIQLSALTCEFVDDLGDTIAAGDLFDRVMIDAGGFLLGDAAAVGHTDGKFEVAFHAPLTFSAEEIQTVHLVAAIRSDVALSGFKVVIADSTHLTVRDLSSGARIEAITDPLVLAQGSVFPIESGYATIRRPAVAADWCPTSSLPAAIIAGRDSVPIVDLTIDYPGTQDHSSLVVREVYVTPVDSLDRILDPMELFHRIGYSVDGGAPTFVTFFDMHQGAIRLELGETGIALTATDTVAIEILADIESETPYDHFAVGMWEPPLAMDATDPTHVPAMIQASSCDVELPFHSGITTVIQPAGQPHIAAAKLPTQIAAPGQRDVPLVDLEMRYPTNTARGDVLLRSLRCRLLRRTGTSLAPIDAATVVDGVHLLIDEASVAATVDVRHDTLALHLDPQLSIVSGAELDLRIAVDLNAGVGLGNYKAMIDDSSFIEMVDRQLLTSVRPILDGNGLPIDGAELSVVAGSLAESFVNFPNPFRPSDGENTTIAFVLESDARIDLAVFSITGRRVMTLLRDEFRIAGSYSDDHWNGLNTALQPVVPGTYFCRLTARFATGERQEYRRKIAVLR